MTGTDEHGTKIQRICSNQGIDYQDHCDEVSIVFKRLARSLNLSHDVFVRTSSSLHADVVKQVWLKLQEAGKIHQGMYSGRYSSAEESFVPPNKYKATEDGTVVSEETGEVLQFVEESNYLMSIDLKKVEQWLDASVPVFPNLRERELRTMLSHDAEGMKELSVSRSSDSVHWGVQVPGDPSQTIYVWLDALCSYLTGVGYDGTPESLKSFWPPHTQFLGKDIMKFHGVFWPELLDSVKLEKPKRLAIHGHWTVEGKKMSKSRGNVIDPFELIDTFGADGLRFYLLTNTSFDADASFNDKDIMMKVHHFLPHGFGNLAKRCTGQKLNPKRIFPQKPNNFDEGAKALFARVTDLPEFLDEKMEKLNYRDAIYHVMDIVKQTNRYWDHSEPWNLSVAERLECVWVCLEMLRICSTAMIPVMPKATNKALDALGIPEEKRTLKHVKVGVCDDSYATDLKGFDDFNMFVKTDNPPIRAPKTDVPAE